MTRSTSDFSGYASACSLHGVHQVYCHTEPSALPGSFQRDVINSFSNPLRFLKTGHQLETGLPFNIHAKCTIYICIITYLFLAGYFYSLRFVSKHMIACVLVLLRFSKSGKRTLSDGFVKKSADSDSVSDSRGRHYKLIYTGRRRAQRGAQRLSTGGR